MSAEPGTPLTQPDDDRAKPSPSQPIDSPQPRITREQIRKAALPQSLQFRSTAEIRKKFFELVYARYGNQYGGKSRLFEDMVRSFDETQRPPK